MRRNITIDDEVWAALTELATEHNTNASEEVRKAIEAYLVLHRKFPGRRQSASLSKRHRPEEE